MDRRTAAIGLPLLFILGAALSRDVRQGAVVAGNVGCHQTKLAGAEHSRRRRNVHPGYDLIGRGTLVVSTQSTPVLQYLGMGLGIPAFGAISAYGAASVLGVPFLLALLGKNEIIVGAALSLLTGVADLTPPTALAGIFAAQAVGLKSYGSVMRMCIIPAIITTIVALVTIAWIA